MHDFVSLFSLLSCCPPLRAHEITRATSDLSDEGIGYVRPLSCADRRTLSTFASNENSGVCTPMTTSPCSLYRSAHARTYGTVRSQLMQVYVQKSTRTTLPCRSAAVSGPELSHAVARPSAARSPCFDYLRSDLKPARTSWEKSAGCSQAAKCPPLATLL